jgi:ABC-2 type transport system ATP-binding protein
MINEGRMVYDGSVEGLRTTGKGDLDEAFHHLTGQAESEPDEKA